MNLKSKIRAWLFDAAEPSPDRSARAIIGDRFVQSSEDAAISPWERDTLISTARDLYRNNPIARGIVNRVRDMVIGQGFSPIPTTSDPEWNKLASRFWREWCKRPEPSGLRSFTDLLYIIAGSPLIDGGVGVLLHSDGTVELIEAERFRPHKDTPDRPPYKFDSKGRVTHWCIWDRDEFGMFGMNSQCSWVRAQNVLVLFPTDRADQILPIPQFSACANELRDVQEINRYTLRQAKIQSLASLVHKRGTDGAKLKIGGTRNQMAGDDDSSRLQSYANANNISIIDTNGDVHSLAPATPSSTYDAFMRLNLKFISSAVGLPMDLLMLYFADGTYSSSKATLTQAKEAISRRQDMIERSILRPLWLWRIVKAVAEGELPSPPVDVETGLFEYTYVQWQRPSWEWMEPTDSLQSSLVSVRAGLSTLSEECEKRGTTFSDVLRGKAEDVKTAERIANELGVDVSALTDIAIPGVAPAAPVTQEERR